MLSRLKPFILGYLLRTVLFLIMLFFIVFLFALAEFFTAEFFDTKIAKLSKEVRQSCDISWQDKLACEAEVDDLERQVLNCSNTCRNSLSANYVEHYTDEVKPAGWHMFGSNKIGITFKYPVESNSRISFEYSSFPVNKSDPSGAEFEFRYSDVSEEYSNTWVATGDSKGFLFGRDGGTDDRYKWIEEDGKYYLLDGDHMKDTYTKVAVDMLNVWNTSFGTKALFYDLHGCPSYFGEEVNLLCENLAGRLMVNFPDGYNDDFESINFYIPKTFSNEDIERLLDSIVLTKF